MGTKDLDVRHCPLCGQLFIRGVRHVCAKCVLIEDEMVGKVITWLRRNPYSSLQEIVDATGAKESIVLRLIREDRIVVHSMMVECERCGTKIPGGKYCAACRREMAQALLDANPKLYQELAKVQGKVRSSLLKPSENDT